MFVFVTAGNDEQVILHDVERGETLNVFLHDDAVYGLSVSPVNDNVFASSSDDGRVLIWDTREPPHGGTHSEAFLIWPLFALMTLKGYSQTLSFKGLRSVI